MTTATQPLPRFTGNETGSATGETEVRDPTEPMAVLALVEQPEMTYEDAARVLHISKTTVYRRVQEAKRQLASQEQDPAPQDVIAAARAYVLGAALIVLTLCALSGTAALWVIALK